MNREERGWLRELLAKRSSDPFGNEYEVTWDGDTVRDVRRALPVLLDMVDELECELRIKDVVQGTSNQCPHGRPAFRTCEDCIDLIHVLKGRQEQIEGERDALKARYDDLHDQRHEEARKADQARYNLRKYGRHGICSGYDIGDMATDSPDGSCTCGLDAALSGVDS